MFFEYAIVLCFLLVMVVLAIMLIIFNIILISPQNSSENLTTYECGFQPFDSDLSFFEIRFYKIALVFLLFDLELMFLLPWALVGAENFYFDSLCGFFIFLFLLFLSIFYEWKAGALEWD